jgi:hypothetical protein
VGQKIINLLSEALTRRRFADQLRSAARRFRIPASMTTAEEYAAHADEGLDIGGCASRTLGLWTSHRSRQTSCRRPDVADRFYPVSVGIENERGEIARMIFQSEARLPIIFAAMRESLCMESFNGLCRSGTKGDVSTATRMALGIQDN